ncbi:hypothetical protein BC835DRAFT_633916 [Cytidiella melzeri]|nr:hypothetical protein BC835DRAFT_633916 [Cytidiella melzeri]
MCWSRGLYSQERGEVQRFLQFRPFVPLSLLGVVSILGHQCCITPTMAVVVCRICDGKQFKNEEAYQQHARDNKNHQKRAFALKQTTSLAPASSGTRTPVPPAAVSQPLTISAKPGYCKTCKVDYGTLQGLQAHFSSGEVRHHPKCMKCGSGFENHGALEEHRKVAHPMVYCHKCAKYIYLDNWAAHQAECSKPPPMWSCPVCMKLGKSEDEIKEHIVICHPELCCYTCGLAFQSKAELDGHYLEHGAHPTCSACVLGFRDLQEFEMHKAERHAPKGSQSQLYYCTICDEIFVSDKALEQHNQYDHPEESYSISEADQDEEVDESPFQASPTSRDELPRGKGKEVDRGVLSKPERIVPRAGHTIPLVLSKSEEEFCSDVSSDSAVEVPGVPKLLRTVSAPPAPTVLNPVEVKPVILDKIVASPEPWTEVELAAVEETCPQEQAHETARSQESTNSSPVLVQEPDTLQTDSPVSSATNSTSGYHSVGRVPSPNRAVSRLSLHTAYRHPSGNSPAPESSSGVASPVSAQSLLFFLSQGMKRNTDREPPKSRAVESPAALQSPPRLFRSRGSSPASESTSGPSTPGSVRSVLVPRVRQEARDMISSASTSSSGLGDVEEDVPLKADGELKSTTTTRDSATMSTASATRVENRSQGALDTETQKSSRPSTEQPIPPPTRFQCRVCTKNPVEPTVTMCGHLFCRSCIMGEISKNLQCPVCRTVMLVRLHVDF